MKTTELFDKLALKIFRADYDEVMGNSNIRANETVRNLFNQSKKNESRNLTYMSNIKVIGKPIFSIFNTKKNSNYLQFAFIKTPIFKYFDSKYHI